jgi:hypothetical protein
MRAAFVPTSATLVRKSAGAVHGFEGLVEFLRGRVDCGDGVQAPARRERSRSARYGWSRRSPRSGRRAAPQGAVREAAGLRHPPLLPYAQEIEPHTGWHPGNFPQAFSHLTLISACVHLIREDEPIAAG